MSSEEERDRQATWQRLRDEIDRRPFPPSHLTEGLIEAIIGLIKGRTDHA